MSKILIAMFESLVLVHLYCILFSLCQPKKFRGPEMNNLHVIRAFYFVCNISLALQVRSVADDNRIDFFGLLCLIGWAQHQSFYWAVCFDFISSCHDGPHVCCSAGISILLMQRFELPHLSVFIQDKIKLVL